MLPWLPEVIGVVTSPTGAVIRDILHRLEDRFPRRVLVWPVRVQGEGSAEQIAAAIRGFNALPKGGRIPRPDLLIVARGGGSLEDLWSFNEEIVVRAAADSMIPLISAVGHETDITLIDFAADKRAPTPTAAAEMAVPVRSELFVEVSSLARRTMVCWQRGQEGRRNELRAAARALPAASELLAIPRQRLDGASRRPAPRIEGQYPRPFPPLCEHQRTTDVAGAARTGRAGQPSPDGVRRTAGACRTVAAAPSPRSLCGTGDPAEGLKTLQRAGAAPGHRARPRTRRCGWPSARGVRSQPPCSAIEARVVHSGQLLAALSYRSVLARGFALVRDEQGLAVHAAGAIGPGAQLTWNLPTDASPPRRMRTGRRRRRNRRSPLPASRRPSAPKRVVKPVGQGSLF